jgi:hypothetical protein
MAVRVWHAPSSLYPHGLMTATGVHMIVEACAGHDA